MRRSPMTFAAVTRARAVRLSILLIVTLLAGCRHVAPKTEALKKVHDSYRTDFQLYLQQSLPVPKADPAPPGTRADQPAFAETLREIRDYRVRFGEDSPEAAHLKVLEGMIYLQSGQFGMARLVAPDVSSAQSKLMSGTGDYARDQLLAMTFPDLISGWQEIANVSSTQGMSLSNLINAADGIKAKLDGLDRTKLAKPEVDEGAVYVATTAAIFYVWAFRQCSRQGQNPRPPCSLPNTQAQWFGKGQELIGRYLTDTEKKAAQDVNLTNVSAGRLRYISWYGFLSHPAPPQ